MIPSDNYALLSRVSKAANGKDTAEKDMVLRQVESVLMGDPLAPEAWCQPMDDGKHKPRQFLLYFEDRDRGIAVFDNEVEARQAWGKASLTWNCYLFGALALTEQNSGPTAGIGEQQILDEAGKRYPQTDGTHRRAFIEGAGWGLHNRTPSPWRPVKLLGWNASSNARQEVKVRDYLNKLKFAIGSEVEARIKVRRDDPYSVGYDVIDIPMVASLLDVALSQTPASPVSDASREALEKINREVNDYSFQKSAEMRLASIAILLQDAALNNSFDKTGGGK